METPRRPASPQVESHAVFNFNPTAHQPSTTWNARCLDAQYAAHSNGAGDPPLRRRSALGHIITHWLIYPCLSTMMRGTNKWRQPTHGGRAGATEARKLFNTRHIQRGKAAHSNMAKCIRFLHYPGSVETNHG